MKNIFFALVITLVSSAAMAQEVYWKKQNVDVRVNTASMTSTYSQLFQRVVLTHSYYECGYYQDPIVETRQGTCYEVTCQGGAGKSPAWDAFYSARKEEKISKLAAAIKGVGKASAESLIQAGTFNSKPRSWSAFKNAIKQAAQSGVITAQVQNLVLSTYRQDNIANLGYAAGNCTYTPYTCEETVVIREGQYVSQTCDDARETVIDTKSLNYHFQVNNAVLLPSETDVLTISLSGAPEETQLKNSFYNSYALQYSQVGTNDYQIVANGAGRRQVALPKESLQNVNLIPQSAKTAQLQISVSANALPVNNTEQLSVVFEVRSCAIGFFGLCGLSWDKKETFNGTLTKNISTFNIPATLKPGSKGIKMEVNVKIYKQNSIYHNANPIAKTSASIKLR